MGVVIRRWVWLETIGVVSGCFPHITYISLLHLYLFFFAAYIYTLATCIYTETITDELRPDQNETFARAPCSSSLIN